MRMRQDVAHSFVFKSLIHILASMLKCRTKSLDEVLHILRVIWILHTVRHRHLTPWHKLIHPSTSHQPTHPHTHTLINMQALMQGKYPSIS